MQLKNKKILVTGGAGFIGSNLVDALVKENDVIVLDDFSTGKRDNLKDAQASGRLQLVEGSILDKELVQSLVRDVDVIYHLAVQCLRVCFDRPHYVHEVNATGTLNLLEAAHRLNPKLERFVYCSSSEAYGTAKTVPMNEDTHPVEPTTVYGASKLTGELYTRAYHTTYGMPAMILRPFNTYGYREHYEGASGEVIPRFVVRILNNLPPIIFGDGSATRDFTFVSDTVESLIRAGECDAFIGQAVNLAYGQEVSIQEIAGRLLKLLGREDLQIEWQPERPGDVHRHYADVARLQAGTGYKPTIDIEAGLKRYVDWFRANYPDPAALLAECQTENWKLNEGSHAKAPATTHA
ncbi:MAG TPA: GDP-mannose 4,6-dehydratase [Coleofasciculaceae cyanobacterium]|jgi:UDP-glucose 4-epimerase